MTTNREDALTVERTIEVNAAAFEYWRWHATQPGEWTRNYLAARGLRGVKAGYAPDGWARLVPTLRRRGFTDAEIVGAGLAVRSGKGDLGDAFRDRLVLPIRDRQDHIIGFTARRNPVAERGPKYLNTTTTAAFDKSGVLYGLDAAAVRRLTDGATLVLVEGALDAEAARRLGIEYVPVAACGTAVTARHLEGLRAINPTAVARAVVMLDPDDAGTAAAHRLWTQLTPAEAGTIATAHLPGGADPAQLVQEGRLTDLRAAVTTAGPLTHRIVDQVLARHGEHLEGRIAGVRAAAAIIAALDPYAAADAGMRLIAVTADALDAATVLAEVLAARDTAVGAVDQPLSSS